MAAKKFENLCIPELQQIRAEELEKRQLNRDKGEKMSQKIEKDCNTMLVKCNLRIQEIENMEVEIEVDDSPDVLD